MTINGGGRVTATTASISGKSLLTLDIGDGSLLTVGNGTGTLTNDGTVRLVAAASIPLGIYTPISAGTWSGTGAYKALGGTWNNTSHVFSVSTIEEATSGTPVTIDLSAKQRILVDDIGQGKTGWSVGASFLASTATRSLTFNATAMTGDTLDALSHLMDPNDHIAGAWNFAATQGYTAGDPVYLSFNIGEAFLHDDIHVWRYDGSAWGAYTANDLTYDGHYASFTVTGFSGYAITAPEPSSLILLGMAIVGVLALACRRKMVLG